MKIGILEYQNHHISYLNTLSKICEDHNVKIFKDYKEAQGQTGSLDLLFVNTITPLPKDMFRWINFKPKCKTILTLHELNTDFKTMKFIINKFDAISVPLKSMKNYIIKNKLYDGTIHNFPFMLHEKVYPNKNNMIVIPGRIENFRRDYSVVWRTIKKEDKCCLLGEPIGKYGDMVLNTCNHLNEVGYTFKTFNAFIPQDIYDKTLKECKSIMTPLKIPTKGHNRLFKEYYGKTKACGAVFESIKYGKEFVSTVNFDIKYKDCLLEDWKKYLEKEVLEEIEWSKKEY